MTRTAPIFAILTMLSACAEPDAPTHVTFATWNVGLAYGYVDHAAARRPAIIEVIRGLEADAVCLQEVWTADDVATIVSSVADVFPHHHQVQLEDTSVGPASCTATESDPLVTCIDAHCASIAASEIAGCVLENCRPEFDVLGDTCTTCVVANIGKEVDEIISLCKTGSARFTYSGANGLLLLSRRPLSNLDHIALGSTNTQRSALAATLTVPGLGDTALVCTHLAADLTSSGLAYTGPLDSWAAENRAQAESVLAFAASYGSPTLSVRVILGDLNSGPASPPALSAELPDAAFDALIRAGYAPYPNLIDPTLCTFCSDNLHLGPDIPSVQIDHIMLDRPLAGLTPRISRVGLTPTTVLVDGLEVATHPSDHFGVLLEFAEGLAAGGRKDP